MICNCTVPEFSHFITDSKNKDLDLVYSEHAKRMDVIWKQYRETLNSTLNVVTPAWDTPEYKEHMELYRVTQNAVTEKYKMFYE